MEWYITLALHGLTSPLVKKLLFLSIICCKAIFFSLKTQALSDVTAWPRVCVCENHVKSEHRSCVQQFIHQSSLDCGFLRSFTSCTFLQSSGGWPLRQNAHLLSPPLVANNSLALWGPFLWSFDPAHWAVKLLSARNSTSVSKSSHCIDCIDLFSRWSNKLKCCCYVLNIATRLPSIGVDLSF